MPARKPPRDQTPGQSERAGGGHAPDPAAKAASARRLRRIEGQIRGLRQMIDDDRDCAEVLDQLSAVCRALNAVGTELLRSHLRQRATPATQAGPKAVEALYDELIDLVRKNRC